MRTYSQAGLEGLRKGGRKGGRRRAKSLTPERRAEISSQGYAAMIARVIERAKESTPKEQPS